MILPITLTIAAAATVTHIWLAIRCGRVRTKAGISIGAGNNPILEARMRAHANFVENSPLFLILLGLVELGGGSKGWLWGAGIAFILARIAHALGMERPMPNLLRAGGMAITILVLLALAVQAVLLSYAPSPSPTLL